MKKDYPPLITPKFLKKKIEAKAENLRILDASWHLPITNRSAISEFRMDHIPGAQFFDIDECCDKTDPGVDHMLPTPEQFSEYVGKLGIDNDSHVVIYDNNSTFGMFSAPRAWFTFHVMGHDKISILDGGFAKWLEETDKCATDEIPKYQPVKFEAKFRPELIKTFEDVERNLQTKDFQLVDARPAGRFAGTSPEPRAGIKSGHVPGAVNIPFNFVCNATTKKCKGTKKSMEGIFEGVMLYKPITLMCGSGVSACNLAFGLHLLRVENVAVYDGSWQEWFQRAKHDQVVVKRI